MVYISVHEQNRIFLRENNFVEKLNCMPKKSASVLAGTQIYSSCIYVCCEYSDNKIYNLYTL